MFFLLIIILILSLYLILQKNRAMNKRLIILVLSYFFALSSIILYISKDTYYYNLMKDYFYLPNTLWRWLFFVNISKSGILWLMNIFSLTVVIISVHFSLSFVGTLSNAVKKKLMLMVFIYCGLQLILYAPQLSIAMYKVLYPSVLTVSQYRIMENVIFHITRLLNIGIILSGLFCLLTAVKYSPKLRLFRFNHIFLAISYALLSLVYTFFISAAPSFYIKVSKVAGTAAYLPIRLRLNVNFYRYFPYIVIPALAVITYCAYRLEQINYQASIEELYLSRGIRSSETTSKIFCHYIKNEILAIQSEVELLKTDDETAATKMDIMNRCNTIFSRVDELHRTTKTNKLNLKYSSVQQVVEQTLEHFTHKTPNIRIQKDITAKLCIALIDPVYIEQALHNIITNAFDAMSDLPEQSQSLYVGVNLLNRWIQITIKDNGRGISKDNIDKIFMPFYSSHAYSQHWGVGLTLTYKIIHAHEGKILVDSEPGRCTKFEILLPYVEHTAVQ